MKFDLFLQMHEASEKNKKDTKKKKDNDDDPFRDDPTNGATDDKSPVSDTTPEDTTKDEPPKAPDEADPFKDDPTANPDEEGGEPDGKTDDTTGSEAETGEEDDPFKDDPSNSDDEDTSTGKTDAEGNAVSDDGITPELDDPTGDTSDDDPTADMDDLDDEDFGDEADDDTEDSDEPAVVSLLTLKPIESQMLTNKLLNSYKDLNAKVNSQMIMIDSLNIETENKDKLVSELNDFYNIIRDYITSRFLSFTYDQNLSNFMEFSREFNRIITVIKNLNQQSNN